jgi:DNA-binding CsgD family transcriptional regulator/tetratricopeptide (TPR) repeat protein
MGRRVASAAFIGRRGELGALRAALSRAADGDPAVVLVGGEAGIGKTRLVSELTAACAANGTRVLAGGCVPVGEGSLPYAPVVEVLRALVAELGPDTVRELVGPSWPELARLAPGLGPPQADPDGHGTQSRLFELLLGLLGRLTEQQPILLVVEDLHWADRSTRDLLAFLVRNLRRERLLLVATYRDDEPGQRLSAYLAELDRGPVERLELPRLDRAETTAQLTGILGAAPAPDLADSVFARSQGNPFFTEELLAVVRAGSGELPATPRDLLRGRVDALAEPARRVLAAVAVAGRQVPHRLLAATAGLDDEALTEGLRAAVAAQLLVRRAGEDGYEVRHALLREVVEADLLPGESARLHAHLAQALTDHPGLADGSPAVAAAELAAHWDRAGEPARALPARVQAGLAADQAHAFPEAGRHYERALQLWEQVPDPDREAGLDRVELLTRAGAAAGATARVERATVLLTMALGQVDPVADPVRSALLHMRLGEQRWHGDDEKGCLAALEEAVRVLPAEPSADRARVLTYQAQWLMLAGRCHEAEGRAAEGLAIARAVGALAEEGHALDILGSCAYDAVRLDAARRIAEEVGNAEGIVRAYLNLSSTLWTIGRLLEAHDVARRGLAVARELGLESTLGSILTAHVAEQLSELGDWEEAGRVLAEALARDTWAAVPLHGIGGLLELGRGDLAAARRHLDLAGRPEPSGSTGDFVVSGLVELAVQEGRDGDARAAVDWAVGAVERLDPEDDLGPLECSGIYALGLRVEAGLAEVARAARSAAGVQEARRRAEPLLATLRAMTRPGTADCTGWVAWDAAQGEAEWSRLEGRSDPARWREAAEQWERLELPYRAAYARFRQAEALLAAGAPRAGVEPVLRAAHRATVALGAGPLRREIELLARRGRLRLEDLEEPAAPAAPAPAAELAAFGLTRRETEVLELVAAGHTDRQIGQELFITPKTASLHVSHILAKLGVAGRGQAAAVAHRLGVGR